MTTTYTAIYNGTVTLKTALDTKEKAIDHVLESFTQYENSGTLAHLERAVNVLDFCNMSKYGNAYIIIASKMNTKKRITRDGAKSKIKQEKRKDMLKAPEAIEAFKEACEAIEAASARTDEEKFATSVKRATTGMAKMLKSMGDMEPEQYAEFVAAARDIVREDERAMAEALEIIAEREKAQAEAEQAEERAKVVAIEQAAAAKKEAARLERNEKARARRAAKKNAA